MSNRVCRAHAYSATMITNSPMWLFFVLARLDISDSCAINFRFQQVLAEDRSGTLVVFLNWFELISEFWSSSKSVPPAVNVGDDPEPYRNSFKSSSPPALSSEIMVVDTRAKGCQAKRHLTDDQDPFYWREKYC